MFSGAVDASIDEQGRFVIPQSLKGYAELDKNIVVIGAGDHFEIWDKRNWENYEATHSGTR